MTTNQPLSLFISSKMQELVEERHAVQIALAEYRMFGWVWENDAGARPEPIRSTYLKEVEACDIYLGIFWLGYGPYTIDEFEHAKRLHKPCLVYEKHLYVEQRSPELASFLQQIQQVENKTGLTVYRFETIAQLVKQVQTDVIRLLTTRFRESRQQPSSPLWNIPYRRNPFFTGRTSLMEHLHTNLTLTKAATLTQAQAISGLSGIGKTQTAIEYAYRYRDEYHTVLWVRAATKDTLVSDFVTFAQIVNMPEKNEQDQNKVIAAVKRWLETHNQWLLILDNADDLKIVQDFMPLSETGHILLTTRTQTTGDIATSIEVNKMDEEEGMLLLLRRSKIIAIDAPLNLTSQENQKIAQAIVKQVDGLPLALDQAGAYIEETGCRLTDYLKFYTVYRRDLLQRNSKFAPHPDVATTFTLAFQKVEQTDSAAADLLRFFAFLDPDAIPEEIISKGAPTLGPAVQSVAHNPLKLQETLGLLRNFSLIRRSVDTGTLAIHRLVQVVIRDDMNKRIQQLWAKRTVKVVSQTFPDVEVANWSQCERCLPHALICITMIEQYQMSFQEATDLSYLVGAYLLQHSRLIEAESILKRDLDLMEKVRGPKNTSTAQSLNNLAELYRTQGKYEQAEPLFQRALAIAEEQLGPNHPHTITTQGNYSSLLKEKKRKRKAQ